MALSQTDLALALQDVFEDTLPSIGDVAAALAGAYADYAAAGQFGASAPELTPAHRDALAGTLAAALDPHVATPATFGVAWSAGVAAFWLSVPVAGAQVGTTAGCPGAAALVASAAIAVAAPTNTAAAAAAGLAAALHVATLTVTAAVAPPPGTILPIA